ncbi:MAG TPA: DUF1223 domain-containing protein [Terracidiphilus sp.]|jgi:hypothetical protein
MQFRPVLAIPLVLLAVSLKAHAASPDSSINATPSSVATVELFTSEGCSSCPPADALLRQINLKQTNAGQLIIGISEHVTYRDNLGWKDPYSSPVFTDRQSTYALRLSPEGPYTPQMVLNGGDQFVGSDGPALERALRNDARRGHFALHIISSAPASDGIDVKRALSGNLSKPLDIIAVVADDMDRSNVVRGENGGRQLQHVSVARSVARVATVRNDGEQSVRVSLPEGMLTGSPGHHLILFAQEPHQGAIVGATTTAF